VEIGSAATAFLCGYLILKLKEGVNCDICLSTLCDAYNLELHNHIIVTLLLFNK
jgi:hypothetical protein